MVHAWIYDDQAGDKRLPHKTHPEQQVSLDELTKLGVFYWCVPADNLEQNPELDKIRRDRLYKNFDILTISPEKLPNYEQKLVDFFQEHLHEDEEIRFVLEGSGYFDVRIQSNVLSIKDKEFWVRIEVHKNDLIVLPAGIYHRFTLDTTDYIKVMRLFQDEPKWKAHNRSTDVDKMKARDNYFQLLSQLEKSDPEEEKKKRSQADGVRVVDSGINGSSVIMKEGIAASALAHYPHMRIVNGWIHISGASSRRPDNTHVGATKNSDGSWNLDIEAQTAAVIQNIEKLLKTVGADLSHLVDLTCYLTDMKYYKQYNEVYNRFFTAEKGPTRTTIAVYQLPHPNLLIEIKAVAVAPPGITTCGVVQAKQ